MNNPFLDATRLKLRFNTSRGNVPVEDLWSLSLPELNTIAKDLNRKIKDTEEEDFLDEKGTVDTVTQVSFDVVKEIITTLKAEKLARETERTRKENRAKIMEIISKKKDEALEGKSLEELESLLDA